MLSKFSVVILQYHQMLDQLLPVLRHNVVFPKVMLTAVQLTEQVHLLLTHQALCAGCERAECCTPAAYAGHQAAA